MVARIQLDVLDERTAETLGDRIAVVITDRDERSSTELELLRSGDTAEVFLGEIRQQLL